MKIIFKLNDISFSYPSKKVLDDISFQVEKGDFLGIVGPNGSGKSTLLKNMASYLKPQKGTIYLSDKLIHKVPPKKTVPEGSCGVSRQ